MDSCGSGGKRRGIPFFICELETFVSYPTVNIHFAFGCMGLHFRRCISVLGKYLGLITVEVAVKAN